MEGIMAFPDRIERTVQVARPPGKVWAALTTAEGLGAWFGNEATIDLRPGGSARMTWDGGFTVEMRVERVEAPAVFGFTWQIYGLSEDDPRRTYVEFTAEPGERRRVRYRLRSAPMQVAQQFLAALARDWDGALDALKDHLDRSARGPTTTPLHESRGHHAGTDVAGRRGYGARAPECGARPSAAGRGVSKGGD